MNFDEQRAARERKTRTFTIGGHDFAYRAGVEPEALADWMDVDADTKEADAIRVADEAIVAFLEPADIDVWRALRQPGALENPITSGDLLSVLRWLISEQGARPTEPSRASSPGSQNQECGAHLTDASSLPAAAV